MNLGARAPPCTRARARGDVRSIRRAAAERDRRLISFAGFKVSHDMLDAAEAAFAPVAASFAALRGAARALAAPSESLDAALSNELKRTNGLRAWPCDTVWVPGAGDAAARALAPNCSTPFTTCSVGKDRAEMKRP